MWLILNSGAFSQHLCELRKFSGTWQAMHVTVIKKVSNIVPLDCRGVIRGFLTSVHIVLFICYVFMVVFDAQH